MMKTHNRVPHDKAMATTFPVAIRHPLGMADKETDGAHPKELIKPS